jgi:L-serine dehydratase
MNIFDIIGPIMIGPSSSHTAGAVRLGNMGRVILGEAVREALIGLHGSFAQTYRGHGTDVALVAGLMGWPAHDSRIPEAFSYAKAAGLNFQFEIVHLGDSAHPNSVQLQLTGVGGERVRVVGASIGGGRIMVTDVDDFSIEFHGELMTLLIRHQDQPGAIAAVANILYQQGVNIAKMEVFRTDKGASALMMLEIDQKIDDEVVRQIRACPQINTVRKIVPIQ